MPLQGHGIINKFRRGIKMAKIVSKIDTIITLPPYFKNLCGKKGFVVELKAGKPKAVPDNIAEYFVTNRGHVFRYADQDDELAQTTQHQVQVIDPEDNTIVTPFNPIEFLEANIENENLEEALLSLEPYELRKICETLKLSGFMKQPKERLVERIITDINVKKKQDEEKE